MRGLIFALPIAMMGRPIPIGVPMTAKKDPAALKTRGRKKLIPADARNRTIRCTDPEYAALMTHLGKIRQRENAAISGQK